MSYCSSVDTKCAGIAQYGTRRAMLMHMCQSESATLQLQLNDVICAQGLGVTDCE